MPNLINQLVIRSIIGFVLLGCVHDTHGQWVPSGNNIYFNAGNVGIGTSTPQWKLHVVSPQARAVYGWANAAGGANFGGYFQVTSAGGTGAFGWASAGTGQTSGLKGQSNSKTGRGVYGLAIATTGDNSGVEGRSASNEGTGVYGFATAGAGETVGVGGETSSPDGVGVGGVSTAGTGDSAGVLGLAASTAGTGVTGFATANSGETYGVAGGALSPAGYGVYSEGRFAATGTKSFQIDHPLDPANKYLNHYCAEGPEPLLIYSGNVILGRDGEAWVGLPAYFEKINRGFHYQLTPIGAPAVLYISQEVQGNRFQIAGGKAGLKVSWTVTGIRDDAFVANHGAPVEQWKAPADRGRYLQPEFYGRPQSEGLRRGLAGRLFGREPKSE